MRRTFKPIPAMTLPWAGLQVCKAYFALLEVLCQSHQGAIATCDGNTFGLLVTSLDYGLKSLDVSVSSQCAAAVDNLASYYFRHAVAAESPSPTGQVRNLTLNLSKPLWVVPDGDEYPCKKISSDYVCCVVAAINSARSYSADMMTPAYIYCLFYLHLTTEGTSPKC